MQNSQHSAPGRALAKNHRKQMIPALTRPIKSRTKAIEQHCRDCIYDSLGGAGTWREQVKNCTNQSCALFNFRPQPISRVMVLNNNPASKNANFHRNTDSSVCGG